MKSDWDKYGLGVNDWDNLMRFKFKDNSQIGGTFCDVGAHKGIVTNHFIELAGPTGFVYSFELNPYNYSLLMAFRSNNCIIENLAISDSSGVVDFYGRHDEANVNIIGHDTSFIKMEKKGEIKSISLDEYFKDKKVDYLKIDVEGAELKVLKGGINTIRNCKYVIVECHFDEDWEEIFNFLSSNDLKFKNLVDDVPISFGPCEPCPGLSSIGRPYQIYLKN